MPAPVVARERVQLVDDDRPQVAEESLAVHGARDEHDLQRLGGRQQHVRRFLPDLAPRALGDVASASVNVSA